MGASSDRARRRYRRGVGLEGWRLAVAGWLGHGDHGLSVAFAVQACGGSGQCVRHGNDNGGWATAATRPRSDWVRRS